MNPKKPYAAAALTAATLLTALWASDARAEDPLLPFTYNQTGLVSDTAVTPPGVGAVVTIDPTLVDPWGLAFQPGGAFWINDQATGVATLYDGNGTKVNKTFTIPNPTSNKTFAGPTGLVWNPTSSFAVPGTQLTSVFVFATLEGTIAAWAPNLPVAPTVAVTAVDNSKAGAVYTGLALGVNPQGNFVYAANVNSGQIDVFDANFKPANAELTGRFLDPKIPAGFVPFGIQEIDGNLAVTYARQNPQKNFVVPGAGAGFVDIFDTNGNLIERLASGGFLNAPWGVTRAPTGFGGTSGQIIVGNFGDGHILAFNETGTSVHFLVDGLRQQITIPGLWSVHFGGGTGSSPDKLFITAGPGQGAHGLFGSLTAIDPSGD